MTTHSKPFKTHIFSVPAVGKVEERIAPRQRGRVRFQATSWPAQFYDDACSASVLPGEPVKVVGRQGLTLLVLPVVQRGKVEDENRIADLVIDSLRRLNIETAPTIFPGF